jgi:hypothetical protein
MSFNWIHYKYLNLDLNLNTEEDCNRHYNKIGKSEGRKCNIYMEYCDFDYKQYALNYPDLSKFNKLILENHWLQYGRIENRLYYNNIDVINNIDRSKPIIIAVIPVFGREELFKYTIRRLYNKNNLFKVIVVGWSEKEKTTAENEGAIFLKHSNDYLGQKWNYGFMYA